MTNLLGELPPEAMLALFDVIETLDRPKLVEALKLCRLHGATLIIAKLDRLTRSVRDLGELLEKFRRRQPAPCVPPDTLNA